MVDPQRLNAELRKLKQLINTDPSVKARFDKDGNGVIDGEEWEQVRQLMIQRLERKDAEARAAAAIGPVPTSAASPHPEEGVAERIFAQDLRPIPGEPVGAAAARRPVLILEQQGGLGQMFEGTVRRSYTVYSEDGGAIARIEQVENEVVQHLGARDWSLPDLHFRVVDHVSGERLLLQKSESLSQGTRIGVLNDQGGEIAHAHFRGRVFEREAMVYSSLVSLGLKVTRKLLRPWTYDIETELGDQVGSIERGWSGLGGFLSGGNKMRIELEAGRASPEMMWALVAAALMFDLSQEQGAHGGGFGLGG